MILRPKILTSITFATSKTLTVYLDYGAANEEINATIAAGTFSRGDTKPS